MQNIQILGDKIGPRYVVKVYNREFGVWGFLVIDNTTLGPGKGGIRMTPTVSEEEVFRLARAMTFKNALAGIPFGGAKAGLQFDPKKHSSADKAKIIRWFARELKPFLIDLYIAGPDVNTTEKEMAQFAAAVGNRKAATGKPRRLGGLPHELGSTGFGVAEAAKVALDQLGLPVSGATVAIEGFGNVGVFAAEFLGQAGAKITAVSDSRGTIYAKDGLEIEKLRKVKAATGSVINYPGAQKRSNEELFVLPIDVLIPAALPDVINKKNVDRIKAKIIVEGANIPMREEFEHKLHERGVLVVPDIVANAGGVISSYAEHRGWDSKKMFKLVREKITASTTAVLRISKKSGVLPRAAALDLAKSKLIR